MSRAKHHIGSVGCRKLGDSIDKLLCLVAGGEARTSTLATRLLEAETDRNQGDAAERMIGVEGNLRDDAFPDGFLDGKTARVIARARVEIIGGGRIPGKIQRVKTFGRLKLHGLVFEDEIAEAVKDRLAFVNLNAAQNVRAVRDENVRTGVDRGVSGGD
jgi:hypothetical protein